MNFHFPPKDSSFTVASPKSIRECFFSLFLDLHVVCLWTPGPELQFSACGETEDRQEQSGLDLLLSRGEPPTGGAQKYLRNDRDLARDEVLY